MIDKVKTILTIALILIVVFAIGYGIVKVVINLFKEPELITQENLYEYLSEENVITSYSTYYYYNSCFENFYEACQNNLYDDLYKIYIKDYQKKYSKEEIMAKLKSVGSMMLPKDIDEKIDCNLVKLYLSKNKYIAEIAINDQKIYMVFEESFAKEYDYNFAIVK